MINSGVAVILAAGLGKRMRSDLPKVFHNMGGRPLLAHVIDAVYGAGVKEIYVVIGHRGEIIQEYFAKEPLVFVHQKEQLGTGHAVVQVAPYFVGRQENVLVVNGDVPLLQSLTLHKLLETHVETQCAATVLTADFPDPTGYGRIVRSRDGFLKKIVEHRDATIAERQITEVNTGTFYFQSDHLFPALREVHPDNVQKEWYLTDCIQILQSQGHRVAAHRTSDWREVQGVNTLAQLHQAEKIFQDVTARVD